VEYEVEVVTQARQSTAAVPATTTWREFPGQWRGMLDEVYACLRQAGASSGANVMLYRDSPGDDQVEVEVGVEINAPFPASGRVIMSALPAGLAAKTTHRGPYSGLGAGHQAVLRWCARQGRELTGQRWEIYGDWNDDPAQLETVIFYGLQQA
jgi:effector-binding domain-containing protein